MVTRGKSAKSVNTTGPVKERILFLCPAPPNGYRGTQHPTLRIQIRKAVQWGSGDLLQM
jgi:hypothetical protein